MTYRRLIAASGRVLGRMHPAGQLGSRAWQAVCRYAICSTSSCANCWQAAGTAGISALMTLHNIRCLSPEVWVLQQYWSMHQPPVLTQLSFRYVSCFACLQHSFIRTRHPEILDSEQEARSPLIGARAAAWATSGSALARAAGEDGSIRGESLRALTYVPDLAATREPSDCHLCSQHGSSLGRQHFMPLGLTVLAAEQRKSICKQSCMYSSCQPGKMG
jgi:hypothetical protein